MFTGQHPGMKGRVIISYVDLAGRRTPVADHRNELVQGSADLTARLVGGDITYAPTGIAFVYGPVTGGTGGSLPFDGVAEDFASLAGDIGENGCNAVYCPLNAPTYATTDGAKYAGNSVVLNAMSDNTVEFSTDVKQSIYLFRGSTYLARKPTAGSDGYWRIMLLNRRYTGGSSLPVYTLFAFTAVNLEVPTAPVAVQSGLSLHVEWPITYI